MINEPKGKMEIQKQEKIVSKVPTKNKAAKLLKNILLSILFLAILDVAAYLAVRNFIRTKARYKKEVQTLLERKRDLKNQISDLSNRKAIAGKYIKMWEKEFTAGQKEKIGVSIGYAKDFLIKLSKSHHISNMQITFSTPEQMGDVFARNNVAVSSTLINIHFDTVTDINVHQFIDDIERNISGFVFLEEMTLIRTKKIDDDYIELLRKNNIVPTLRANLQIRWYGIRSKN